MSPVHIESRSPCTGHAKTSGPPPTFSRKPDFTAIQAADLPSHHDNPTDQTVKMVSTASHTPSKIFYDPILSPQGEEEELEAIRGEPVKVVGLDTDEYTRMQ